MRRTPWEWITWPVLTNQMQGQKCPNVVAYTRPCNPHGRVKCGSITYCSDIIFASFFLPPHYVVVQKSWQKRWHPRINASTFHMAMTQDSVIICGGAKKMAKTTPPQSVTLLCLYALSHDRALWSADLFNEKKHKLYLKSWSWLADAKYVIKKFTKKIIKVCVTKDNRFYFTWSHP